MIPVSCKRLIEVDFPIAKVSEHSAREKSIRHGHPSTLHLWWARRPLAACRAVLLGLLLPAPTDRECPADFKSKARVLLKKRHSKALATDQELQDDLLAFIGEFADWDNASNALYLEIGRGLVKAAHPAETPVVVDPFAGGGSIPLEALRLGCEAFASDLNPVACLILKTLLEDIPRYGNAEFKLPGKDGKEVVVHGLADALRHVAKQVKEAAEKELAQFYPPDPDGSRYDKVLTAADREVPLGGDPGASEPHERGFLAYVFEALSKEALRQVLGDAETEGFEEDARLTALFLWTLQATKTNGNGGKGEGRREKGEVEMEEDKDEDEGKPKKAKPGFTMPFDTFIRITRPMGIHYPALEGRVLEIEKGVVRLLSTKERTEELLGEAAERPGIEISLDDFRQLELGLVEKKRTEAALPTKPKKGTKAVPGRPLGEATFTTLDRIHRAMLLFGLGRSTLLRQVLETEMRQGKRFERLALALNALYPDGSDERRMPEGVQAAMRGVR